MDPNARELARLSRRLQNHSATIRRTSDLLMKQAAIKVITEVVHRTPVDTGMARSNWKITVDQPFTEILPPYSPGHRLGRGETRNAGLALLQAGRDVRKHKHGKTIFITNNVPYIETLNTGSSAQAPANFVVHGIMTLPPFLRTFKLLKRGPYGRISL